jgi:hypothetical protein
MADALTYNINYPWGNADVQTPAYASTIAITVNDLATIVEPATLTGNVTFTVANTDGILAGAELVIQVACDATPRTITFGTGFSASAITGVASKKTTCVFKYDGTNWILAAANTDSGAVDFNTAMDLQTPTYAATIAITATSPSTYVRVAATGALTLTVTAGSGLKAGARLFVEVGSDTTARDTTFSTGFVAPTLTGVISKKKTQSFVYDGTNFIATSAGVQIN